MPVAKALAQPFAKDFAKNPASGFGTSSRLLPSAWQPSCIPAALSCLHPDNNTEHDTVAVFILLAFNYTMQKNIFYNITNAHIKTSFQFFS